MTKIDRLCANSNCSNIGKHLCAGCGEEIYCSKDCQKVHWSVHKVSCKKAFKPEAAAFLKNFDSLSVKQLKNIMKAKAATMDGNKKSTILSKLENIVEKPALVKLVEDNVLPSEVESLLGSSSSNSSNQAIDSSGKKSTSTKKKQTAASTMPAVSPEQLRQQAAAMRKDPSIVRRSQPSLAHMTDDQIRQYADQLDAAAADPSMLKEFERMMSLSPDEKTDLQHIQDGLSGYKPMDAAWIDSTIKTFKTKPGLFKALMKGKGSMLGGVSDEQIESFIDMGSKMEVLTLKRIVSFVLYLGSLYKPASEYYKVVDSYTFGYAKVLVFLLVGFVFYLLFLVLWYLVKFVVFVATIIIQYVVSLTSTVKSTESSTISLDTLQTTVNTLKNVVNSETSVSGVVTSASIIAGEAALKASTITTNTFKKTENADDEFEF